MTLAMKIVPRFPARVDGSGPITVTKENGVYKIAYDISGLAAFDLDDATTSFITIYDADTGTFGKLTIQALIDEIGTNLDPVLASLIDASDGIIVTDLYRGSAHFTAAEAVFGPARVLVPSLVAIRPGSGADTVVSSEVKS